MAVGQFAADNTQMIESVKNAAPAMALRAMANWSNTLTVNHISYSPSNNRVWKNFYYSWFWNYSPVLTLTDKVALARSGDFISESDSVAWSYTAYASSLSGPKDETWTGSGAEGMHDLNAPDAAVGTSIDIVGSLSGYAYTVYAHSGNYTVDVHQFFHTETDVAAIGQYFHQSAVIGGVGLSVTGVPSITAGSALNPHPSDYKSFIVP